MVRRDAGFSSSWGGFPKYTLHFKKCPTGCDDDGHQASNHPFLWLGTYLLESLSAGYGSASHPGGVLVMLLVAQFYRNWDGSDGQLSRNDVWPSLLDLGL
jgi:hypothetical protein